MSEAKLQVYSIDDELWIIASSPDEAVALASAICDFDANDDESCAPLDVKELAGMRYFDDLYNREGERSFLEQVGKMVIEGDWEPGLFAISD